MGDLAYPLTNCRCLTEQRISRNWIVHRSGLEVVFGSGKINSEQLVFHVTQIARGDFLVSRWSYEFHEKQTGNWKNEQEYIDMIMKWLVGSTIFSVFHDPSSLL